MEKKSSINFMIRAAILLIAIILLIIGACISATPSHYRDGLPCIYVGAAIFVLIIDYIIAKEFEAVAIAKGYSEQKYFWYSFLFGIVGYLLVLALPKK